ncbi:MAG: hypothetical protein WBI27_03730, partial [Thermoanaerobaculia bacterium]
LIFQLPAVILSETEPAKRFFNLMRQFPEQEARVQIDVALEKAGWTVQDAGCLPYSLLIDRPQAHENMRETADF